MTTWLYLQCVGMFIIGQGVDLFIIKIPELKKLYNKANEDFNWKMYWKGEWNIIVGTQLVGALVILGLDQLINWKPLILNMIKWWFAGLGFVGSAIIVSKASVAKKYIMNIIDRKTNIADNKV